MSGCPTNVADMVTVDDVRQIVAPLPRSYEVVVRDQIKFRIGQIVYLAFSRDETVMGFAFPKEERAGLVASEPDKFSLPRPSDMRYNWVHVQLDAIDLVELREIVIDAWRMCVPKSVAATVAGKFCETFEDVRNYYVTAGGGRDIKCSPDVDIGPAELFLRDLEIGACHQR